MSEHDRGEQLPPPEGNAGKAFPFAPKPKVAAQPPAAAPPAPPQPKPAWQVPPPPPQPASWHPAEQAFGQDTVPPAARAVDVVIPDAPPAPPEKLPAQALFAALGTAVAASIGFVVLDNILPCAPWILLLWLFGSAIGGAAAKFGGSGTRMGIACAVIALVSMILSGLVSAFVGLMILFAQSASAAQEEQPIMDAQMQFALDTLAETAETLDAAYNYERPEEDDEEYPDDEYSGEYQDDAEDDSEPDEAESDETTSVELQTGSVFWDLFFIFNCWGVIGLILGTVSAYKIGSGFDQPGYR